MAKSKKQQKKDRKKRNQKSYEKERVSSKKQAAIQEALNKQIEEAQSKVRGSVAETANKVQQIGRNAVKGLLTTTASLANSGIGAGFVESMNLEQYKLQLNTVVGESQRAGELMKYGLELANDTSFNNGEIMEATIRLESMGMSAEEWLPRIGDMAGATGKSFEEATSAIVSAVAEGDVSGLTNFGLDESMIQSQTDIINQMTSKFSGGMDQMGSTLRGRYATVSEIIKNGLATIVGMQSDGSVKPGSLYDLVGQSIEKLLPKLQALQDSGKLEAWASKLGEAFSKIIEGAQKAFDFMSNNKTLLLNLGKVTLGILSVFKAISGFKQISGVISTLTMAFQAPILTIGSVVAVIALVIAVIVLLYMKSAAFRDFITNLIAMIGPMLMTLFTSIKGYFVMLFTKLGELIVKLEPVIKFLLENLMPIIQWVCQFIVDLIVALVTITAAVVGTFIDIITSIVDFLVNDFATWIQEAFNTIVEFFKNAFTAIGDFITGIIDKIKAVIDTVKNIVGGIWDFFTGGEDKEIDINTNVNYTERKSTLDGDEPLKIGANAMGTRYWTGGLTTINEHGMELIDLPRGSKVYTHHQSKNMGSGSAVQVNVSVDTFIGKETFANECGEIIGRNIQLALANM